MEEINPQPGDNIIEIGPGHGELTFSIMERTGQLTAVEIDRRVVEDLRLKLPGLNLVEGDFMKVDLNNFIKENQKLRFIGNIPYNLTSPIVFKFIENYKSIKDAVLMIQYEVAKRVTAEKGTKDYGILSVILNYFAEVKFCFKVSPNVFYPKPKVSSAVIHIYFKEKETTPLQDDYFIKIVKAAFGHRRKTLRNSLSSSIFAGINFEKAGVPLDLRAEQLDQREFIKLAEAALSGNTV